MSFLNENSFVTPMSPLPLKIATCTSLAPSTGVAEVDKRTIDEGIAQYTSITRLHPVHLENDIARE